MTVKSLKVNTLIYQIFSKYRTCYVKNFAIFLKLEKNNESFELPGINENDS